MRLAASAVTEIMSKLVADDEEEQGGRQADFDIEISG